MPEAIKERVECAEKNVGRYIRSLARDIKRHALVEVAGMDQRQLMVEGVRQMRAYWQALADEEYPNPQSVENSDCLMIMRCCDSFITEFFPEQVKE